MHKQKISIKSRALSCQENTWTRISSINFEDSAYNNSLIHEIFVKELEYMNAILSKEDVLVEVGCGTGKFCLSHLNQVSRVVGIDISEEFLSYAKNKELSTEKLLLIHGDATHLVSTLHNIPELKNDFWDKKRIVCCVLNTLGIMPASNRQTVINEMARLSGDNGVFFLVVFNGDFFERGIQEFYRTVPQLCGEVKNSDINLATREIHVATTGYYTHWFDKNELISLVENAGIKNYTIEQAGVGLFVIGSADPIKNKLLK